MKKILIVIISIILIISVLASCNKTQADDTVNEKPSNESTDVVVGNNAICLTVNGVKITPNKEAAPIIEALGEPLEYTETESCGFEGKDKTYKYNGFIIDTITLNNVEYIYIIQIVNDMTETDEGATIGMTSEEIQSIYKGKCKVDQSGHITVEFTNGLVSFFIKNGACNAISYQSTTLDHLQKEN